MANLLIIIFFQAVASGTVPALIMDTFAVLDPGPIPANPFHEMSENSFKEIALSAIDLSDSLLIFVEENFSVEDISSKDEKGTPFRHIHKSLLESKVRYIPSVINPLKTLHRLLPPKPTHVQHVTDAVKYLDQRLKYHYLYFDEPTYNTSRVEMLRLHDLLIRQAYEKICVHRSGPIVMIYTGMKNSVLGAGISAFQKEIVKPEIPDRIMVVTDQTLMRLEGIRLHQGKKSSRMQPVQWEWKRFARSRFTETLIYFPFTVNFNFEVELDRWTMESVVLLELGEEVGRTHLKVGAPLGCSYYCAEPLVIVNTRDNSYISINTYQFEPQPHLAKRINRNDGDAEDPPPTESESAATNAIPPDVKHKNDFDRTVNCGIHFNSRLLSGLFVAIIVIAITTLGILMINDCASNNRLDDPNQKPLVIIAQL